MSIRVSEEELDKLKEAARIESYASYSEFVRRTALLEASKALREEKREERQVILNNNMAFEEIVNSFDTEYSFRCGDTLLVNGDSLIELKKIPDNSISLILTDPPYHSTQKKNIYGDTAFKIDEEYLEWMQKYSHEWKRILKHNGSVFCFCSSSMECQLATMFSNEFNILSRIVWTKPNAPGYDGWKQKMKKEALRQWYAHSERILFMEPNCSGNLFQSYFGVKLKEWRAITGLSGNKLTEMVGAFGKVNHGGAVSNWEAGRNIPSRDQYERIKVALLSTGKITDLPDYEDIIRPFNVSKDVEFTDVWSFENVKQYKGKHPAEKPVDLLSHAILATTYENDIVLDCFSGSGATSVAAQMCGRKSVSIEIEKEWYKYSKDRIANFSFFEMK